MYNKWHSDYTHFSSFNHFEIHIRFFYLTNPVYKVGEYGFVFVFIVFDSKDYVRIASRI